MTNKHKGEFSFEALDKTWTGRFSLNVLAEVEDQFDMSAEQFFRRIAERPRLSDFRAVFLAGLKRNHPELTADLVGDLLQDVIDRDGSFDALSDMFAKAARAAFPEQKEGGQGTEAKADPTSQTPTAGGTGQG